MPTPDRAALTPDTGEHLLSPLSPVSPLPCKLAADKHAVTARYPEPHDAMIGTVKALGWQWNAAARVWQLDVDAFNGPALDRLVEAGAALLAAGFILSVPSSEVARRIVAGEYQPVQERWITKLNGGKHAGWFGVKWGRKDDLYKPAMKIHGARYIGGGFVAAPPESYDEVFDFAQVYGYSISEGAHKLADEARARAWEIAVVEPPPLLFVDPPWNLSNINSFYTKAERTDYLSDFGDFERVLFERIEEIAPAVCYLEVGFQAVDRWQAALAHQYPTVQRWSVTYYRKHPCYILRGGKTPTQREYSGMDEEKVIAAVGSDEHCACMGDLCMGRGLVGLSAYAAGKPFVGTELNPRRLAVLLQRLAKKGADVQRMINA